LPEYAFCWSFPKSRGYVLVQNVYISELVGSTFQRSVRYLLASSKNTPSQTVYDL
jgi:hypothetical protein